MLRLWMQTMSGAGLDPDALERVRAAYARDVAILPPDRVAELVAQAGFEAPLRFHQAGMLHGWCARRGCRSICDGFRFYEGVRRRRLSALAHGLHRGLLA